MLRISWLTKWIQSGRRYVFAGGMGLVPSGLAWIGDWRWMGLAWFFRLLACLLVWLLVFFSLLNGGFVGYSFHCLSVARLLFRAFRFISPSSLDTRYRSLSARITQTQTLDLAIPKPGQTSLDRWLRCSAAPTMSARCAPAPMPAGIGWL
jgi:Na+(H+)/acetate symporter ActP